MSVTESQSAEDGDSRVHGGSIEKLVTVGVQHRSKILVFLHSQEPNDKHQSFKDEVPKLIPSLLHDGKESIEGVC